jgi:peptidoglycan/xylan/chitin deacetylase (PgdA/CDA1 family)
MSGIFTISLDFELHWGGFEKWPVDRYHQYFLNTRKIIPEMLALFEKYEIHVTWATVGLLFHQSKLELLENLPAEKPTYKNASLSAYEYIHQHQIGNGEQDDPLHFAPSLVKKIIDSPYQELATHTYAHFYCNEEGQTLQQFRQDLKAAQNAARNYGKVMTSLVFPRNQFNDEYLKICFEEGITAVRSNPEDWFWKIGSTINESRWKRLNRGVDAYLPFLGKKNTYLLESVKVRHSYPIALPASRLLRPYRLKELFLNDLKILRINSELERAAKSNELYHLWWHPHNFGYFPNESLKALEKILQHFAMCRNRWQMRSLSMAELALLIRK